MSSCVSFRTSEIFDGNMRGGESEVADVTDGGHSWYFWVFIVLILILLGYGVYKYFYPTIKPTQEQEHA